MEFTFESYKNLVKLLKEKGYEIVSYNNIDSVDKGVVMRHDVDFDLEKALEMAKIENEIGISSTYFVLLTSNFYNVFSKKSKDSILKLQSLGHEIGLHYDEEAYVCDSIEDIKEKIKYEIDILSNILGNPVESISMHRPSKMILERNIEFENVVNSYSKKYFEAIKYVSDSRMKWREDVIRLIEKDQYDKFQILTHPFWYSKNDEDIKSKFVKFFKLKSSKMYEELDKNFSNIQDVIIRSDVKW
ncbi:MAG: hypothetical protein N4A76_12990 [Firmicutes bacterium]|jgi:hypothetical protein|nr:hypothetical protein [Bacillota bacterium]